MGGVAGREAPGSAHFATGRDHRRQRPRTAPGRTPGRARRSRPGLPAARLVIGRMVLPRWCPRCGYSLLPGPPPAVTARASANARGRRRNARLVHEAPAPRSVARDRQRLQTAAAPAAAADLRAVVHGVSVVLHAEA